MLCPAFGLHRGSQNIGSLAVFGKTPLHEAARAGALLMLKEENEPEEESNTDENISLDDGHESNGSENAIHMVDNQRARPSLIPSLSSGSNPLQGVGEIHGTIRLPPGWTLTEVPRDASFKNDVPGTADKVQLANFARRVIALGQTVYAGFTVYNTRRFQMQQFG